MPSLQLTTNVKLDEPRAFVTEFSRLASMTLRKPETYITVEYKYNEFLTFAGTFEPAFILQVVSLDNLNPAANEDYSKAFFEFFETHLEVPGNRGYISFIDPGRAYLGHKGTTFQQIFGK